MSNKPRMTIETLEHYLALKRYDLILTAYIKASGFAGVTQEGKIVDRRYYPEATPILGIKGLIPNPKRL